MNDNCGRSVTLPEGFEPCGTTPTTRSLDQSDSAVQPPHFVIPEGYPPVTPPIVFEEETSYVIICTEVATSKIVALKTTRDGHYVILKHEYDLYCQLDHPNIVKLVGLINQRGEDCSAKGRTDGTWIVMEYVEGNTLRDLCGKLTEDQIRVYALEMLRVLGYMHQFGMIPRDLQPANILCHGDSLKVADFGVFNSVSILQSGDSNTVDYKKSLYSPPEAKRGEGMDVFSVEGDIYRFACCICHAATGRKPFDHPPGVRSDLPYVLSTLKDTGKLDDDTCEWLLACLKSQQSDRPKLDVLLQHFSGIPPVEECIRLESSAPPFNPPPIPPRIPPGKNLEDPKNYHKKHRDGVVEVRAPIFTSPNEAEADCKIAGNIAVARKRRQDEDQRNYHTSYVTPYNQLRAKYMEEHPDQYVPPPRPFIPDPDPRADASNYQYVVSGGGNDKYGGNNSVFCEVWRDGECLVSIFHCKGEHVAKKSAEQYVQDQVLTFKTAYDMRLRKIDTEYNEQVFQERASFDGTTDTTRRKVDVPDYE